MTVVNVGEGESIDARDDQFARERSLLFSLAYRMLGSVADAEDIVQEAYLRWKLRPTREPGSPRSYLCAIVTRLCLDYLKSARVRREEYVGTWLPEPLVAPLEEHPLEAMALAESLSTAFLLLLERLSSRERAAFLLRDVFCFEYAEIARMIDRAEPATRQIVKRARDRIGSGATRFSASEEEARELAQRFTQACATGDLGSLMELLAEEVVTLNDGGGKVPAARNVVVGRERVARLLVGLFRKWPRPRAGIVRVNDRPGVLVRAADGRCFVFGLAIQEGRIQEVYLVVNPDKLGQVPPLA